MKNELKGFVFGLIAASIAAGGIAYAKTGSEIIEAAYNNIKVYVDGILIDPKDPNGNTVEPFIYNGTTYLPVRAVGEAVGKQVSWDGATSSVYLGEVPGQVTYLTDVMDAYSSGKYTVYTTKNGKSFKMGGTAYTNGFAIGDSSSIFTAYGYANFNLNGKYKTITFDIGHVDDSNESNNTVQIFVDDRLVEEIEIGFDDIARKISIPVNNGLKLAFQTTEYGGMIGFGNVILE